MKNLIAGFKLAFSFLTILPFNADYNSKTIKSSLYFYPLVGLFSGGILYFSAITLSKVFFEYPLFSALCLLTIEYLISNFFHIDGFCDTVDALYFTKPGKDKLAILRDPHIGAYAVVWLVLLILFKLFIYQIALTTGNINIFLVFPVIGYLTAPFQTYFLSPLFEEGLGKALKENTGIKHCLINSMISFAVVFLVFKIYVISFALCLYSIFFVYLINKIIKMKFNGFNGDTIGFGIELLKLFFTASFILTTRL